MDLDKIANQWKNHPGPCFADLRQDILALAVTEFKRDGFFVEFGAMDGRKYSNTYLLEKDYGWQGIVAEPGRIFHWDLKRNRNCKIDLRAVAGESGHRLRFKETNTQLGLSGLIDYFDPQEYHARTRANSQGAIYDVETVSLNDLLDFYQAPTYIDYISMDTEGSEPAILKSFDFSKRKVGLWTVEHNWFERSRQEIYDLMTNNGYTRILPEISTIDDWYVPTDVLQ